MTLDEIEPLWDLAGILHLARLRLYWGPNSRKEQSEPWPEFTKTSQSNSLPDMYHALTKNYYGNGHAASLVSLNESLSHTEILAVFDAAAE